MTKPGYHPCKCIGCPNCAKEGKGKECTHCYCCSETGHLKNELQIAGSGKQDEVRSVGQTVTKQKSMSRKCIVCCSNESSSSKLFHCLSCHSGLFCSRKCQRNSHHKTLCKYICQLKSQQQSRQINSANKMSLGSSLNYKQRNKLVNLVSQSVLSHVQ